MRRDSEAYLRDKARWYLEVGIAVVWLALADTREVIVLDASGETRFAHDDRMIEHPALPRLAPAVRELFVQLDGG